MVILEFFEMLSPRCPRDRVPYVKCAEIMLIRMVQEDPSSRVCTNMGSSLRAAAARGAVPCYDRVALDSQGGEVGVWSREGGGVHAAKASRSSWSFLSYICSYPTPILLRYYSFVSPSFSFPYLQLSPLFTSWLGFPLPSLTTHRP